MAASSKANGWLVVAIIGAAIFLVGIVRPASAWIPSANAYGTDWVEVGIAVFGGIVLGLGLSRWYDNRPGGPISRMRARRDLGGVRDLPTYSVYDPNAKRSRRK